MKFYLYEKGDGKKVLAMLKGGHNKFGVVFTWYIEVLAILKGGCKTFPLFERGDMKCFTLFSVVLFLGGGAKSFGPTIFPFCTPPGKILPLMSI